MDRLCACACSVSCMSVCLFVWEREIERERKRKGKESGGTHPSDGFPFLSHPIRRLLLTPSPAFQTPILRPCLPLPTASGVVLFLSPLPSHWWTHCLHGSEGREGGGEFFFKYFGREGFSVLSFLLNFRCIFSTFFFAVFFFSKLTLPIKIILSGWI